MPEDSPKIIYTIGHSMRTLEESIVVLKHHSIERLIDIRHFPSSRHNPQFNRSVQALPRQGIEYLWLEQLGGFREGGYLAYTATPDFSAGLDKLEQLAGEKRTAYMCAEVKWFKCHRRHVSDALAKRGWEVIHVIDEMRVDAHRKKTNRIKCD